MKLSISIILFILSSFSNAFGGGNEVGNGGTGVVIDANTVYLLDLMESGQEANPYFNNRISNVFRSTVSNKMDSTIFPNDLISQKISEIYDKDHIAGAAIITALKIMNWNLIDTPLNVTPDVLPTISVDPEKLVAVATRRFGGVAINRGLWNRMPQQHQAALVVHELVYAMMPKLIPDISDAQKNGIVRSMIGIFFSPQFEKYNNSTFNGLIQSVLPNWDYISHNINPTPQVQADTCIVPNTIFSDSLDSITIMPYLTISNASDNNSKYDFPLSISTDGTIWDLKYAFNNMCEYLTTANINNNYIEFNYAELSITLSPHTPAYLAWSFLHKGAAIINFTQKNSLCGPKGYSIFKSNFQKKFPNWNVN